MRRQLFTAPAAELGALPKNGVGSAGRWWRAEACTSAAVTAQDVNHRACSSPTLIFRGFLLLHGYQGREMGLVVRQNQRGAMAFVGWNFQGKIDASKGNRGKGWKEIGLISFHNRLES